jgi:hypothetical protein
MSLWIHVESVGIVLSEFDKYMTMYTPFNSSIAISVYIDLDGVLLIVSLRMSTASHVTSVTRSNHVTEAIV